MREEWEWELQWMNVNTALSLAETMPYTDEHVNELVSMKMALISERESRKYKAGYL